MAHLLTGCMNQAAIRRRNLVDSDTRWAAISANTK